VTNGVTRKRTSIRKNSFLIFSNFEWKTREAKQKQNRFWGFEMKLRR